MYLAISMPTWLIDFWSVYGNMITPVLVTLLTALVTAVALKIRSDAKVNAAKTDMEIEALKEVANRENYKPQILALEETIKELKQEIKELKQETRYESEMINLAFQNSNLTPEVKDNLTSITNKIKYGTEDNLVKELEAEHAKLKEENTVLKAELEKSPVTINTPVETETKKRIRR
jgi:hypothetical protein